jgi:hypothetical protein
MVKRVVYADGNDLKVANSDGSQPYKLASLPDLVYEPTWSPDGAVIRFQIGSGGANQSSLWRLQPTGQTCTLYSPAGTLLRPNVAADLLPMGSISCSGRKPISGSERKRADGWAKQRSAGSVDFGSMNYSSPLPSKDGKKLFVVGALPHGELSRYDVKSQQFSHFFPDSPPTM